MRQRAAASAVYRGSFTAFVYRAFEVIHPGAKLADNWHVRAICWKLQQIFEDRCDPRLVLNLPPRSLKSFIVSVCLPAWELGHNAGCKIICASYSDELARKFSRDCRALMESEFYRSVFLRTRLNPRKSSETEFETTARGFRYATSVGGTLTGRGGDVLIIDDPLKAHDAYSELARTSANEWLGNTAISRLDEPGKSKVIVVMQRLHVDDMAGHLIERSWPSLVLPAIATETTHYEIGPDEFYTRQESELLQQSRDDREFLESFKREHGSYMFAAQYQQNPTPPEGNMIKPEWLKRFDRPIAREQFQRVVLACDPSGKSGEHNDYTAIAVAGIMEKSIYLLNVRRGHWTVLEMRNQIIRMQGEHGADLCIVEDTSSGMGLIQLLNEQTRLDVIGERPKDNKETRLLRQQGKIESGQLLLPKDTPWLAEFEHELFAFPYDRHDDQVDALLLLLEWHTKNRSYLEISNIMPISLKRDDYEPLDGPRRYSFQ